jgi:hypothetical protein
MGEFSIAKQLKRGKPSPGVSLLFLIDLRKIVAGIITPDAFAKTLFDLSGDGALTTDDLVILRKKIAGLI